MAGCKYCGHYSRKILHKYHPDYPAEVIQKGEIDFQDFIHWVQDGNDDRHWNAPYHDLCNSCAIQYDYIVKLETHTEDADYIVMQQLKGRGINARKNSHRISKDSLSTGRELKLFRKLSTEQIDFLIKRHKDDFAMFGYEYDRISNIAKCKHKHLDGRLCC